MPLFTTTKACICCKAPLVATRRTFFCGCGLSRVTLLPIPSLPTPSLATLPRWSPPRVIPHRPSINKESLNFPCHGLWVGWVPRLDKLTAGVWQHELHLSHDHFLTSCLYGHTLHPLRKQSNLLGGKLGRCLPLLPGGFQEPVSNGSFLCCGCLQDSLLDPLVALLGLCVPA